MKDLALTQLYEKAIFICYRQLNYTACLWSAFD